MVSCGGCFASSVALVWFLKNVQGVLDRIGACDKI